IYTLIDRGWSQRRIALELGLNRETVARHVRLRGSKPAILPAGIGEQTSCRPDSKPAIPPTGIIGRKSACRFHEATIREKIERGLSAQRIFQDLRVDQGFEGGYDSVKRYVRRLSAGSVRRVERMECAPGDEAQIDFGAK
ncbi:MAG: hypothetical protein U1D97_00335, partial [Desulfuromonadales bacterium]|nr:hypothetical protein [Desulfuromonadales bacterium]